MLHHKLKNKKRRKKNRLKIILKLLVRKNRIKIQSKKRNMQRKQVLMGLMIR